MLEPEPPPVVEPDPEAERWTRRRSQPARERASGGLIGEPVEADTAGASATADLPNQDGGPGALGTERPDAEAPASTSHPVTVSWRGEDAMGALELDGPNVVDPDDLIIVEPPSQLVAQPRRRRPERPPVEDPVVEVNPEPPDEIPPPPRPAVPERVPVEHKPADSTAPRTGRGVLLLAVLLVILAVLVWYFLLRDSDPASAVSTTRTGVALVAAALAPATGQPDLAG